MAPKKHSTSNVNAIVKIALLNKEFEKTDIAKYVPKDQRFYDALTTMVVRDHILDGKLNLVKFYAKNGFDARVVMAQPRYRHTVVEFALHTAKRTQDSEVERKLVKLADYLKKNMRFSTAENPIFKFKEIKCNGYAGVTAHYRVGNYNCKFEHTTGEFKYREYFDGVDIQSLEEESDKDSEAMAALIYKARAPKNLSGLSSLVINELILKYKLTKEESQKEGILHMFASYQLWEAVSLGNLERVKFYLENGYSANLECKVDSFEGNLQDFADRSYRNAPTPDAKEKSREVREWLREMFSPDEADNTLLEIISHKPEQEELRLSYASRLGKHEFLKCIYGSYFDEKIPK